MAAFAIDDVIAVCRCRGKNSEMQVFCGVAIYPGDAQGWLSLRHPNQRRIRLSNLKRLVREINQGTWSAGVWDFVAFDVDGWLVNGQHRLQACVDTGKPIVVNVLFGVPHTALHKGDQSAARDPHDRAKIAGRDYDSQELAAAALMVQLLGGEPSNYVAEETKWDMLATPLGVDIREACLLLGSAARFSRRNIVCAVALALRSDAEKVSRFCRALTSGANLAPRSPVLALREQILGAKEFSSGTEWFLKACKALELTVKGSTCKFLRAHTDGFEFFALSRGFNVADLPWVQCARIKPDSKVNGRADARKEA